MSDKDQQSNVQAEFEARIRSTLDGARDRAVAKRRAKGYRTARENVADLCDRDSFIEYGQLAVAAQRRRRESDDLRENTAADGIITGLATANADAFGAERTAIAVIANDYTVLAGTQGFFHHKKLDRILKIASERRLPVVMYTEGGGGRPGDVDVSTQIAGLDVPTFSKWAGLSGLVPRIVINNGYCFAGNAALFGSADITIATETSWIGMAGPAMIQGGGLGTFEPTEIGPVDVQKKNGVIDIVAHDEAQATAIARKLLGYFQGRLPEWSCADQEALRHMLPADRRFSYPVRNIIETLADTDSFLELREDYGKAVVTGFLRMAGQPIGLLASDCKVLGGAIDAEAGDKSARFMTLCGQFGLPVLSLCDTPGFMVGPDSEREAAVRRMSNMFLAGAKLITPLVAIFLRKGYGLGAMALVGGSFATPVYCAAWPTGEFGAMGLEGAVSLGFRKELAEEKDPGARRALFDELVARLYNQGKATEAASFLEIDAVIDPAETRDVVIRALISAGYGN